MLSFGFCACILAYFHKKMLNIELKKKQFVFLLNIFNKEVCVFASNHVCTGKRDKIYVK